MQAGGVADVADREAAEGSQGHQAAQGVAQPGVLVAGPGIVRAEERGRVGDEDGGAVGLVAAGDAFGGGLAGRVGLARPADGAVRVQRARPGGQQGDDAGDVDDAPGAGPARIAAWWRLSKE